MTAVAPRVAPSPVPLHERSTYRDVSQNVWVRRPGQDELEALFGVELIAVDLPLEQR